MNVVSVEIISQPCNKKTTQFSKEATSQHEECIP